MVFRVGDAVLRSAGRFDEVERLKRSKTACGELPWGQIPQGRVRPAVIVFLSILLSQYFCLHPVGEYLKVQELVSKAAVKTLNVSIFPRLM